MALQWSVLSSFLLILVVTVNQVAQCQRIPPSSRRAITNVQPHEFLDIMLPPFVAQGYSRRLVQNVTPEANPGDSSGPPADKQASVEDSPEDPFANVPDIPDPPNLKLDAGDLLIKIGYNEGNHVRIPRGVDDTTPWFKFAMTALQKAKGGELHIEAGEFILNYQFVILSSNTLVKGAGMTKTTLKLADYAPGPWKGAGFLRWINLQNITVTDLTLDGNKEKQWDDYGVGYGRYGIYMHGYKNAVFLRVRTQNFQRYGFDPHGQKSGGEFIWSQGLTVIDCVSQDNNWDGFTFDQTNNIYCRGNYAEGNGRHGFNIITGSKYATVFENKAVNNGRLDPLISHGGEGCGFMTDNFDDEKHSMFPGDTRDVLYMNNVVEGADVAGFCIKAVKNITMIYNRVTDAKACLAVLDGASGSVFAHTVCTKTPEEVVFRDTAKSAVDVYNVTYS